MVQEQLRSYYEAESNARLRPAHGSRRRMLGETFAVQLKAQARCSVLDVGAGPASDHDPFAARGIGYVGVDLAIGNAVLAAEVGQTVVPASLFHLPFVNAAFPAGWSMSTFQHVPDDQINDALIEFVRVLEPGAPVMIGLWGGRDEIIEAPSSTTGLQLPRHFTLRSHDRIRSILDHHLIVETDDTFPAGPSDWEYHVSTGRTPHTNTDSRPRRSDQSIRTSRPAPRPTHINIALQPRDPRKIGTDALDHPHEIVRPGVPSSRRFPLPAMGSISKDRRWDCDRSRVVAGRPGRTRLVMRVRRW